MKKFWEEFKKFISKGNIIDLALAVIIGAAFNKIVSSLVNDVIMPLISCAVGGADVSDWKWVIKPAEYDTAGNVVVAETALRYGSFIQSIIDFLIIALTLFIMFKIFTYSKNKLNDLGKSIVNESKKFKDKHSKKNKGNKDTADVVVEEKVETTEQVVETPAEAPAAAPVEESTQNESNKDDLMIHLLTEIRDSLKTK